MASAKKNLIYLTEEEIKPLLTWEPLLTAIESTLEAVTVPDGGLVQPPRLILHMPTKNGVHLSMPGFSERDNMLAVKLVTAFGNNDKLNLPTIMANIFVYNPDTGKLEMVMEGNHITAWRTAAASIVATKYMAQRHKIIAILGTGAQGKSHIEGMHKTFNPQEIRVWNREFNRAQKLVDELGITSVRAVAKGEEAVRGADVICTATNANEPILYGKWLNPGAHINAIGAGLTHHSELDKKAYDRGILFVDSRPSAEKELAGLLNQGYEIKGEVGELINKTKNIECYRDETNVTIFHSLGMAVEDVVSAKLVYENYQQRK